jgi:hypothetical protein
MSNPSQVWAQLALPNYAQGGIPFVQPDNATIDIDVLNLFWNSTAHDLHLATGGDMSGTDTLNFYFQADSYLVNSLVTGALNSSITPGFTTSSSRGTPLVPLASATNDFLGKFSGWGYVQSPPAGSSGYSEFGGIFIYAKGAIAGDVGGEIHFITKGDGSAPTDRLTLDNVGRLFPTAGLGSSLGKGDFGFDKLYLGYQIGIVGNQTINKAAGTVLIAAAGTALTLTNNLITANTLVMAQVMSVDATAKSVAVTVTAGQVVFTLNAAATAQVKIGFVLINTD